MISIDIRRKAFGPDEILADINLTLTSGEVVAILGPSGIGKTTLLRILAGLDEDFEGSVERPQRIAMVFQEPVLMPWRSVVENLTIVTGASRSEAQAALERVGLAAKAALFPNQLSLGQQRRLALARALVVRPELLVLDEPFASLDEALMQEMLALTRTLIQETGATTLLVTHSQAEAQALADRIVRLDGRPARLVS